jgi:hypothetical protein
VFPLLLRPDRLPGRGSLSGSDPALARLYGTTGLRRNRRFPWFRHNRLIPPAGDYIPEPPAFAAATACWESAASD